MTTILLKKWLITFI